MTDKPTRRDLLRGGLAAAAGALTAGALRPQPVGAGEPAPKPSKQNTVPANAEQYEATVPDTLDLAHRAELAMHGIAGTVDPNDEYMMWSEVFWNHNPPYMQHGSCDVEIASRFLEAMTQLRLMCGGQKYQDVEEGMAKALVNCVDKNDGQYYAFYKPNRPWHMAAFASAGYETKPVDYAMPSAAGLLMIALVLRNDLGLTPCADVLKLLARGLEKSSIQKDDYAYYPEGGKVGHPFSFPRSGWKDTGEPGDEHEGGEGSVVAYMGNQMWGLSMWAARTGDEQALELAGKLARFVMKPKFWGNAADPPHVAGREQGHVDSHFHARNMALRGLLEYGIVAGDTRVCDFVRSAYEYMRTYGIRRIGFAPTWPNTGGNTMEGCVLGDFVAIPVKLSDARLGDYWDDADRVIRNHLVEGQYINRDLLERVVKNSAPREPPKGLPGQICTENVLERCLGIFATYLTPTSSAGRALQCCTGNASRGLYWAWEPITRSDGDEAQVNLLLNRAAPWLDIDSYLPYEGKVVIRNKTARRIAVRIPAWVDRRKLRASVNGVARNLSWVGAYQVFGDLKPADTIELGFPVPRETVHLTANCRKKEETTYAITMRGNTVVDITPRDESPQCYPMYLRDHMKAEVAPMKTVQRYVAGKLARW